MGFKCDCKWGGRTAMWSVTKERDIVKDVPKSSEGYWSASQENICEYSEDEEAQWNRRQGFFICDCKNYKNCAFYEKLTKENKR